MARPRRRAQPWWTRLPPDELLDVRLCDLELTLEGTALGRRVERLYAELERAELRFRPYVWLSTDWFTPEGSTGFAIPFYLAHPRLLRLEHAQMLEAEGSTAEGCMKILRHETGHALDNGYRLHRRRDWREIFGRYSDRYSSDYTPRIHSKDFVQNLDYWYAQSHPAEDYAESFAVWLRPRPPWRRAYAGWPALQKLERLDAILQEIRGRRPEVTTRDRPDSLPRVRTTLREHYRRKKAFYGPPQPWMHDRELLWLFSKPIAQQRERAASCLREFRAELRARVSTLTGYHRYVVDQALTTMIGRCRELDLRVVRSRAQTRMGAAVLLTIVTLSFARGRRPRYRR
ncbi:MAG: hypothetical protein AB7O97_05610 [Planctomycetota bacterium]